MFDPSQTAGLAEADAVARGGDGVAIDVTGLLGHPSLEAGMLEVLLAGEPGPELVALLTEIESIDLTAHEAVTVAQTWEKVARWVAARQHQANLRVAGPTPTSTGRSPEVDLGTEEVRLGLALSPGQADRRVTLARDLTERLPLTAAALEAGEIPVSHANALVDLTTGRTPEVCAQVEERVLVRAPHQSLVAFKRCVRRALIRFDPLGEALAHLQAASQRDVVRYDNPETGLSTLIATMPVIDGAIVWNTLDAYARRDRQQDKTLATQAAAETTDSAVPDGDGVSPTPVLKTLGAYRADTLLRWAQEDLAHEGAPRPQRRPIEVQVVIDLPTALAMADNPAEIPGYGPLPAPIARLLTEDASWRRLITDPVTGHLLDYGHTVYTPPQALRDYVIARDRMCTAPHCEKPAAHAQIDHADPFPRANGQPDPRPPDPGGGPPGQGGATSSANTRTECTWHHLLKTHHGWTVQPRPDGSTLWTSPNGRAYLVPPNAVLPL